VRPCTTLAIAWLLRPGLFSARDCHVAIETEGELTLGRTVVDWSRRHRGRPNAKVVHEVDADGFFALLTERLARLTGS
jgi:purine nucleosidase